MSNSFSDRNDYDKEDNLGFDPYKYCNGVPVNNRGIKSMELLQQEEDKISREKMAKRATIKYLQPGITLLRSIHHFLFSSLYGWAGEFDETDAFETGIGTSNFKIRSKIRLELNQMSNLNFDCLSKKDLAKRFAFFFFNMWKVKPFYDGNIRTLLVFLERFATFHGLILNIEPFLQLLDKPQVAGKLSLKEMLTTERIDMLEPIFFSAIKKSYISNNQKVSASLA